MRKVRVVGVDRKYPHLLNSKQIAEILGVHTSTVQHKFTDGSLTNVNPEPGGGLGGKRLYATVEQVYELGRRFYFNSYYVRKHWEDQESPTIPERNLVKQLTLPEIPNPVSAPIPTYPIPPPQVINVKVPIGECVDDQLIDMIKNILKIPEVVLKAILDMPVTSSQKLDMIATFTDKLK